MNSTQVVLGIDIGGTNTVFGLVDENGKTYYKREIPTEANLPADLLFLRLFKAFNSDFKNLQHELELVGIGVGAPSANFFTGTIENPSNFNWGRVNVVKIISEYYSLPALVTNDANIAAIGEMVYGTAKGLDNFILITLGTGLGSGIVVNGDVVYGSDGFAGEIGHTIVEENGRHCNCGRKGCLETYVSASGICRTVFELLAVHNDKSILREFSFDSLTSKLIQQSAMSGDKIANLAFEITGEKLGKALANSVAHLSPEAIILFGGLALSGDLLITPVKKHLEENLLSIYKGKVKVMTSSLMESENAALLGAASIIWKELGGGKTLSNSELKTKNANLHQLK